MIGITEISIPLEVMINYACFWEILNNSNKLSEESNKNSGYPSFQHWILDIWKIVYSWPYLSFSILLLWSQASLEIRPQTITDFTLQSYISYQDCICYQDSTTKTSWQEKINKSCIHLHLLKLSATSKRMDFAQSLKFAHAC